MYYFNNYLILQMYYFNNILILQMYYFINILRPILQITPFILVHQIQISLTIKGKQVTMYQAAPLVEYVTPSPISQSLEL